MADQSDVEEALAIATAAALYPQGSEESSVPGPDCRIYRGWPNSAALDTDLAAGRINVTVFPSGTTSRITTRFAEQWLGSSELPTLIVSTDGMSVTFSGTADPGQIAGVLVDGEGYAYRTKVGDTPQSVAANLAVKLREVSIVHLSDQTLTMTGASHVAARVASDAPMQQEVRRQEQALRITCWCPTPTTRDATATAIDQALSRQRFLALADNTQGRLSYSGTTVFDQSQNARLYRRDLIYNVEFATIIAGRRPSMLFGNLGLNGTYTTT